MTSTCQLSQHEIRFLIDMVDEKGNGRIDYRALFHRFYQTSTTLIKRQAWMASVRHTIRNVIVVVRHGARFPLKPFPQDGHWPKEMDFWRLYGGRLTPVGTQQLYRLGQRLRTKYILQEQLLEELAPDLSLRVRAYTSNQDRTLMSAQRLAIFRCCCCCCCCCRCCCCCCSCRAAPVITRSPHVPLAFCLACSPAQALASSWSRLFCSCTAAPTTTTSSPPPPPLTLSSPLAGPKNHKPFAARERQQTKMRMSSIGRVSSRSFPGCWLFGREGFNHIQQGPRSAYSSLS